MFHNVSFVLLDNQRNSQIIPFIFFQQVFNNPILFKKNICMVQDYTTYQQGVIIDVFEQKHMCLVAVIARNRIQLPKKFRRVNLKQRNKYFPNTLLCVHDSRFNVWDQLRCPSYTSKLTPPTARNFVFILLNIEHLPIDFVRSNRTEYRLNMFRQMIIFVNFEYFQLYLLQVQCFYVGKQATL